MRKLVYVLKVLSIDKKQPLQMISYLTGARILKITTAATNTPITLVRQSLDPVITFDLPRPLKVSIFPHIFLSNTFTVILMYLSLSGLGNSLSYEQCDRPLARTLRVTHPLSCYLRKITNHIVEVTIFPRIPWILAVSLITKYLVENRFRMLQSILLLAN